jgi:hypothetical protein
VEPQMVRCGFRKQVGYINYLLNYVCMYLAACHFN